MVCGIHASMPFILIYLDATLMLTTVESGVVVRRGDVVARYLHRV